MNGGLSLEIEGYTGPWASSGLAAALARRSATVFFSLTRFRFLLWRSRHRGGRFAEYYAFRVRRKLSAGRAHRTLGKHRWPPEEFCKRGASTLAFLLTRGLERHHSCVEYGCGSLRVGQHLIRFLGPGLYTGLDVTDGFYRDGLELLERGLVEEKRPRLAVACPHLIAEIAASPPDFLLSIAVLQHVDPRELDDFLGRIVRLLGPQTKAFVSFREWKEPLQTAEKSWSHPAAALAARIRRLAPDVQLRVVRGERVRSLWDPSRKSLLCISRLAAAAGQQAGRIDA